MWLPGNDGMESENISRFHNTYDQAPAINVRHRELRLALAQDVNARVDSRLL